MPRRWVLSVLCVVLLLPACSADPDDGPEPAVDALAAALSEHSLDGVPLVAPEAAAELSDVLEPLADYDVAVTTGEVTREDGEATATLHWAWTIEGREWTYDTTAHLVQDAEGDAGWQVQWQPSTLIPDLTADERLRVDRQPADRAEVLGADDEVIVTDRPVGRYGLDKALIEEDEVGEQAERIAEAVGIDPQGFRERAEAMGPRAFVEAIVLRPEDAQETVAPDFTEIPGARVLEDEIPLAPSRHFARELLGRVGPATAEVVEASEGRVQPGDEVGLSGLQARYDDLLRGTPTIVVTAVDVAGCAEWPVCEDAPERTLVELAGEEPQDLRLTLDPQLQLKAERILHADADADSPASAIVALRPSTGAVLAAASGPGSGGLNTATEGQYAPGSTFKVVTALALLRAGLTPDDVVACPDTTTVDGRSFKNYDDYPASAVGDVPFRTAFAHSCNTALIGRRDLLGEGDLAEAAAALGLAADHDLGYPAYLGQVPEPEGETEHAASLIGQGRVLASPLAMATVAASVQAGHTVVPHLVADTTASPEPAVPLTEEEAEQLRDLMRAVVTDGSGSFLADVPGEEVRAKTGTAEYGSPGEDGAHETHAWMIGTQGDLAVAVFVETGVNGAQTAGPLLEELLR